MSLSRVPATGRIFRPALAAAFALAMVPVSAGWWLGSQNTLHLGYDEPAGKTATKKTELKNQFATNSVNLVQEVMKTNEMPNVTPGSYVYKVSALKGPSTYKEAYGFVYASSVSITAAGLVDYAEAGMDREPSGVCFWTGSSWCWALSYHCPFETAKMNFEIPYMATVYNWYKGYYSNVNDVVIGGDWNRAATHANFDTLEAAGCTKNEPNVLTSINTSGAWASAYDHFVWNPTNTSGSSAAREAVDPVYWRANVSDHAGVYMWVNN